MTSLRALGVAVSLLAVAVVAPSPARAQSAKEIHATALHNPDQSKTVQLLCQAAKMDPKNKEFQNDCDTAHIEMIRADKDSLKTALDAFDAGNTAKAKRYASYVSGTDPETHRQALDLLAKLNPAPQPDKPPAVVVAASQAPILNQAQGLYDLGNLAGAKSTAQGITDPALKTSADRIIHDVDRYASLVGEGDRHAQAKEFDAAALSYQSAFAINSHVASDDLAGKARTMHDQASIKDQPKPAAPQEVKPQPSPVSQVKQPQAPVEASADKVKRLLAESAIALNHNDLDVAGREFKQILDLDSSNASARQGIAQITAILNKDPARLEKTLRDAITAFYSSQFEDAESKLNRYLGADGGKKKGAAFFYLGATEASLSLLEESSRRTNRVSQAQEDFKQARSAGYQPVEKYVSTRVLDVWKGSGM